MFQSVPQNVSFPKLEEELLAFWKGQGIYEQSLAQRAGCERFVFYEGPPTANGMPHPGHCLTRAIKDLFPRYRTMRGYLCERKAGWDTHGLPVEVEVCKELGIHSKEEIETFGVEPFIHKCQESVWRYMQEWERLTERLGFWIKLDEAYVTYHQSFVESVWWSLKNLFDRGLLYQGHKIVWWWAQGGTALSSGEVGQGYREVADPSVYVRFPLVDEPGTSLLVWTTTPWTLPSNQFAAVHPHLDYATVVDSESGQKLIIAAGLVEAIAAKVKRELPIESTCRGIDLIGKRYVPPFDYYYKTLGNVEGRVASDDKDAADGCSFQHVAWRVVPADFVTIDSGSGVVHQAPAFGEVDFDVLLREQRRFVDLDKHARPELINAVGPDGKFTADAPDYQGRWVKDCDKDITRNLRERGLLFHFEQYVHDYPFCWRADQDPLIQYPRESWFIKTTDFKDRMLANNEQINWLPEHIKHGRFGNFLESNVDWALSRERYWGTPLPIWVCEQTGQMEAVGGYAELLAKPGLRGTDVWEAAKKANPKLVDDLKVHKPYIDAVTYDSPFAPGARMKRVTEVIDCWYDSGAMPFAQWGYPHTGQEQFAEQFPADFISEALDQTRGWFYSQLAISTLLFSDDPLPPNQQSAIINHKFPHPYRNCIVLGLMLGEDGQKMSKSKRNYREPSEIFNKYGADALRWYFFANQPPWTSIRYKEQAIKDSIPEFLLRLWNVYSFFVIYANIDGFDPAERLAGEADQLNSQDLAKGKGYRPVKERGELDRWVMSELNRTAAAVVERMDAYDNYVACAKLTEFVDALSNWYVRRSRDRFWSGDKESPEKLDAYWTLYECLVATSKLIAPFTPFLAEGLWRNLAGVFGPRAVASVHLCDYPTGPAQSRLSLRESSELAADGVAKVSGAPTEDRNFRGAKGDDELVDDRLSEQMRVLREIASLGRAARMEAKLKVRQPLAKVEVILAEASHQPWLEAHDDLLRDELNVKQVEYTKDAEKYISYQVQPNYKRLGPRVGKLMPGVKTAVAAADAGKMLAELTATGKVTLLIPGTPQSASPTVSGESVELDTEDIQVRLQAKPGWAAAQGKGCVVVLSTELTPALLREGLARDLVRLVQDRRKDLDCQYTDRIEIGVATDSAELRTAITENDEYIRGETLATRLAFEPLAGCEGVPQEVGDDKVTLFVKVLH